MKQIPKGKGTDPDIAIEDGNDLPIEFIAGIAGEILTTLHAIKTTPLVRHSILTTAFVNNMKQMIKDSPPPHFLDNQQTAILLLEKLLEDVKAMQPGVIDARSSEDGSDLPGRQGSPN